MKKRVACLLLAAAYPLLNLLLQTITQLVPALYASVSILHGGGLGSLYRNAFADHLAEAWPLVFLISSGLFLLIVGILFRRRGLSLRRLLFPRPPAWRELSLCLLLGFFLFLLTTQLLAVAFLPEQWVTSYEETWADFENGMSLSSLLLYTLLLAPVMEELIFRGLSLHALRQTAPVWLAVLLQAVLFAAYHMNLLQFAYALIPGAVLGFAGVFTGSLWGPIAAHILYNCAGFWSGALKMPEAPWGYGLLILFLGLCALCLLLLRRMARQAGTSG